MNFRDVKMVDHAPTRWALMALTVNAYLATLPLLVERRDALHVQTHRRIGQAQRAAIKGFKRQPRFKRKPIRRGEPCRIIFERGTLASPLDIGAKKADSLLIFADENTGGLVHTAPVPFLMRTRFKTNSGSKKLGVKQPDISNMLRGQFRQFSLERLMRFLVALDHDVEIVVKEHHGKRSDPSSHVTFAAI